MKLYKPDEMADLILALAAGVTVHVTAEGYERSDGVPVYTEDVTELRIRHQVRPTADNRCLKLTMEGTEVARLGRERGRDVVIALYERSRN